VQEQSCKQRPAPHVSLLDFGDSSTDLPVSDRLWNCVLRACAAERLGFHRYWIAEHHVGNLAWNYPVALLGVLAAKTSKMRVGTAGVLVKCHSAIDIAQAFGTLSQLYVDRIDLGLAAGSVPLGRKDDFRSGEPVGNQPQYVTQSERVVQLLSIAPSTPARFGPTIWVLGSSVEKARFAGAQGVCYSHSLLHIGGDKSTEPIDAYRNSFSRRFYPSPCLNVAVHIDIVRDPHPECVIAAPRSADLISPFRGSPLQCYNYIRETAVRYGVDDVVVKIAARTDVEFMAAIESLAKYLPY